MPKVSVIIPVYNVEPYLRACLDSVAAQTLKDIEILCIDDCSSDASLQILQEYSQKDPRIKIFQNSENRGLSSTRNVGIDNSCGEYIQFVDSDDEIEQDTLELLYQTASANHLDVLKFLTDRQKERLFDDSTANHVFSGQDMFARLVCHPYCGVGAWILFLNKNFVDTHNLKFDPDLKYGEDVLYTFQVINAAQRCMCINERKYKYYRRENSLVTGTLTDQKIFYRMYLMQKMLTYIFEENSSPAYRQAKFAYLARYYAAANAELDRRLEEPDMNGWDPELQRIYRIFFSGQGWLENLIDRKKLSLHREEILHAKRIYIFGAGKAAQRLIQILYQKGIEISGLLVSDKTQNRQTVYGYPVFSVHEVSAKEEQPLVLCAVTGSQKEIYNLLNAHGFCNVVNICP